MHEQAIALERERILADLHDGLGASLIGLLRHVQSGQADLASIERRVHEALCEMRLAIDGLWPHEGRLDTVLANLRHRIGDTIEASGVSLEWRIEALPLFPALDPAHAFSIQRIVLEAVTNALKHSGARRLLVAAHAPDANHIQISVEDDGKGFDPGRNSTGIGIYSMQTRARCIAASVEIVSRPGAGTTVRLTLAHPVPPTAGHSLDWRRHPMPAPAPGPAT